MPREIGHKLREQVFNLILLIYGVLDILQVSLCLLLKIDLLHLDFHSLFLAFFLPVVPRKLSEVLSVIVNTLAVIVRADEGRVETVPDLHLVRFLILF